MKNHIKKIIFIFIVLALIVGIGKFVFFNKENENINDKPEEILAEEKITDTVIIKNSVIENETLIDEFIEIAIDKNQETEELNIVQDEHNIKITYTSGEYAKIMANSEGQESVDIPIEDGSQEDYKRIYGYFSIYFNEELKGEYSVISHDIKRRSENGIVTVYLDSALIDYTERIDICSYDLESSNYSQKFELSYNQRKDLGIEEIYDNKEYKVKTFGGDVNIVIENDMVYSLEDALNQQIISCEDILEQAKVDVKYGICQRCYYSDGGSTEYVYNKYTILKLDTLDGEEDLVIGMQGNFLNSYNKNK